MTLCLKHRMLPWNYSRKITIRKKIYPASRRRLHLHVRGR